MQHQDSAFRAAQASAVLVAAVAALPGGAWAARPLVTDDAGVLAHGDCELEALAQHLRAPDGTGRDASLQLGCGVGWGSGSDLGSRHQLALGLSGLRESDHTTGAAAQTSRAAVLSGKSALWSAAGAAPGLALAIGWQVLGAKAPGEGWRHAGTGLNLIASRPLSDTLVLHANLGHTWQTQTQTQTQTQPRQQATSWGLALEHAGLGDGWRWAPVAELFGDDREPPWWNLGLSVGVLPERLLLMASLGRQFSSGRPRLALVGAKLSF